jgi:eukaryotic-like serine/threonine-protein kinase
MAFSVASLCNELLRNNLLSPDKVRTVYAQWTQEAGASAWDLASFTKWLEKKEYATAYQIGVLERGNGEQLFLNDYKVLDRIGRGRMAGVYKATHRLGQTVAIKVLPPSRVKDPQAFGRFKREVRMAMRLKHPNIVRTFQTGTARSLHYLVMEYLDGETLAEVLLRRGRLPPTEAVRLVHQALLGLQHIHEEGLVHRDLNPNNLMLVDGQPQSTLTATVKILDIGMGRTLFDEGESAAGPTPNLTVAGDLLGSPGYMAAEQARDAHSADIRADIYSLGCILYHALTGQVPFPDTNRVRQLVRQATEKPRPIKEFNLDVPDGLQQILDTMLAKDPAQRFPTPDKAARALKAFLAAGPEVRRLETEPQMKAYLGWLDSQAPGSEATAEYMPSSQIDVVLEPVPAAPSPARVPPPLPPASPRAAPARPKAKPAKKPTTKQGEFRLNRRDLVMIGMGIGGIVFAVGCVSLYMFLTRNRGKRETPADKGEKP